MQKEKLKQLAIFRNLLIWTLFWCLTVWLRVQEDHWDGWNWGDNKCLRKFPIRHRSCPRKHCDGLSAFLKYCFCLLTGLGKAYIWIYISTGFCLLSSVVLNLLYTWPNIWFIHTGMLQSQTGRKIQKIIYCPLLGITGAATGLDKQEQKFDCSCWLTVSMCTH